MVVVAVVDVVVLVVMVVVVAIVVVYSRMLAEAGVLARLRRKWRKHGRRAPVRVLDVFDY